MATKKYVSLARLTEYDEKIKKVISDGDIAAKAYADSLASNYDAAGTAATKADAALAAAKTYADNAANAKDAAIAQAQSTADGAVTAAAAADSKAVAAQNAVDALDAYVGDIPSDYSETNVIAYINKKAEETLSSATGGSSESAASVLAALNTYKAENDTKVNANATAAANAKSAADAAQTAADAAQTHSEGVASDLAEAVEALEGADAAQVERIAVLEGQITGLTGAMHFIGVQDNVPTDVSGYKSGDVIVVGEKEYVFNGTAFVEFGDVSAEGERIAALETHKTTYEAKVDTLETKMAAVEGVAAAAATQTALDAEVQARTSADSNLSSRIDALDAKFGDGEGSVADMVADAQAAAVTEANSYTDTKAGAALTDAKKYTDDEIDKVDATVATLQTAVDGKAAAADLTALTNRVTTAEGEIDTLQSEMDAVEALAAQNQSGLVTANAEIAKKAAKADLDAAVTRIAANETAIANFVEVSEEEIAALFTA